MDYKKKYLKYKIKYIELKKQLGGEMFGKILSKVPNLFKSTPAASKPQTSAPAPTTTASLKPQTLAVPTLALRPVQLLNKMLNQKLQYPIHDGLFTVKDDQNNDILNKDLLAEVKRFINENENNISENGSYSSVFTYKEKEYTLKQIIHTNSHSNNNNNLYDFENEISILKQLVNVDSILQYIGSYINVDESIFDLYLLTAYSDFQSLKKIYSDSNIKFKTLIIKAICINLHNAIIKMHEKGIIHMDIKPDNILVNTETGDVILINFRAACNCLFFNTDNMTDGEQTIENNIIKKRIIECFIRVFDKQLVSYYYLHFRFDRAKIEKLLNENENENENKNKIFKFLKHNDLWAYGICIYYLFYREITLNCDSINSNLGEQTFAYVYAAYNGRIQSYWKPIIDIMNEEFKVIDEILVGSGVPTMSKLLPLDYQIIA